MLWKLGWKMLHWGQGKVEIGRPESGLAVTDDQSASRAPARGKALPMPVLMNTGTTVPQRKADQVVQSASVQAARLRTGQNVRFHRNVEGFWYSPSDILSKIICGVRRTYSGQEKSTAELESINCSKRVSRVWVRPKACRLSKTFASRIITLPIAGQRPFPALIPVEDILEH
jgi:hypothetical protein